MATVFKSTYCTTTILGMINQLQGVSDLAYVSHINTTINKKRGVFPNYNNGIPTEIPTLKYFGIGIGGYFNTDDGNVTQPYYPLATNMDIYEPIPFRVVPADFDMNDQNWIQNEKNKYRMRTTIMLPDGSGNTVEYVAYWLKLIEYAEPNMVNVTKIAPDGTESAYDLSETDPNHPGQHPNLYPEPNKFTTPSVDPGTATTISVEMEGVCEILGSEVIESINHMYNGNLLKAKISEIGLYTGVEDTATPRATTDYNEALYVQLAGHRCTNGTDMSQPDSVKREHISFKNGNIVASVPAI